MYVYTCTHVRTYTYTCSGSGQGSSGASTDSACVSLALHAFGEGEVVVLAACKDARLRLWSCEVRTVSKFCRGVFIFVGEHYILEIYTSIYLLRTRNLILGRPCCTIPHRAQRVKA